MLFGKHTVHELDQDAIYNRKIDVGLHKDRLKAIKNRKNLYEADLAMNQQYYKNFKKFKSQSGFGIIRDKIIKKDNEYYAERLNKIKKRQPDTSGEKLISFINTRNKFFESYRMLQRRKINEENIMFTKRVSEQNPVIDNKVIAEEFEEHKRLYFKLRRIKPSPYCKKITSFYGEIPTNNNSSFTKSTMENNTKYSPVKDNNIRLLRKTNSTGALPAIKA
ncbi:MAG: hypothetical protein MJ252_27200 [archaeon]|nr:hypothetical protein [archaeon]